MFCMKCGAQIEEGSKFCPSCGAKVEPVQPVSQDTVEYQPQPEVTAESQGYAEAPAQDYAGDATQVYNPDQQWTQENPVETPAPAPKPKKPLNKGILAAIAGVLVIAIVAIVLIVTHRTKINVNDYVVFEESGYDGFGYCYAYVDFDSMIKDNKKAFGLKEKDLEDGMGYYMVYGTLAGGIEGTLSKRDDLALGETITWTWEVNAKEIEKAYKIKLKYSDIEHEVAELTALKEIDPFADIEVTFEGFQGAGRMNWSQNGDYWYSIEADKTSELTNGDTVTLTIGNADDEYLAEYHGVKLSTHTKTYTVEGLEEAQAFDPFAVIDINCYGRSGEGYISYSYNDNNEAGLYLGYSFDKSEGLSNGDTITVSVNVDDYEDINSYVGGYGYYLTETSKQITLDGFSEYVTSLEMVPEDALTQMKEACEKYFEDEKSNFPEDNPWESSKFVGAYLLNRISDDYYDHNKLFLVYQNTTKNFSYYTCFYYGDLEVTSGELNYFYPEYYNVPSWYDDNSTFEKGGVKYTGFKTLKNFEDKYLTSFEGYEVADSQVDPTILDEEAKKQEESEAIPDIEGMSFAYDHGNLGADMEEVYKEMVFTFAKNGKLEVTMASYPGVTAEGSYTQDGDTVVMEFEGAYLTCSFDGTYLEGEDAGEFVCLKKQ